MRNLKVSKKLILSFGAVLVLFIISVIAVSISLNGIKVQLNTFYTGPWETRAIASDIALNIAEQQKSLYKAIATTDEKIITPSLADVEKYGQKIQESLVLLENKVQPENRKSIQELANTISKWDTIKEEVLKLTKNTSITSDEISKYMQDNATDTINEVSASINSFQDVTAQYGDAFINDTGRAQSSTTILLIIMCVLSVAAGIGLCIYITKSITAPLQEIEAAAGQMAEGILKVSINYHSKDELGKLSDSMRTMSDRISYYMTELASAMTQFASGDFNIKRREAFKGDFRTVQEAIRTLVSSLNSTMAQINQAADQVSSGSDQVSSGSQALSQGATEQASSVEQLAATINEISRQVTGSASNAAEASSKANAVGEEMAQSNQKMQEMIGAMSDISESSNEIGKIIKTIEDIAFQTNILALNAAVEAARAGAAGKGFAVVADEVRNLANKSSEASKNTSVLIESSLKAVENGTRIADETAGSLLSAVKGSKDVAATIDKISEAAKEQADSITQVMQGVEQISNVVQTNSATAEESAAASEELSGQAQMLKKLVSQFRLIANSATVAPAISLDTPEASPSLELVSTEKY